MDPRERYDDRVEAFRTALDGRQMQIHTSFPGIVQAYDPAENTATVQPAIQYQVRDLVGNWNWVKLPLLIHVPVFFPSGGGFTLTFPLAIGDEVFVSIAERCIDGWWEAGGVQPQAEFRMHDLSDGFCFPKVWSKPKVLSNISVTTAQLRSDDGSTYVEIASGQIVTVKAPTKILLDTPLVEVTGAIQVDNDGSLTNPFTVQGSMTVTGDITAGSGGGDQVGLRTHKHGGVQTGGGSTGSPTGGT